MPSPPQLKVTVSDAPAAVMVVILKPPEVEVLEVTPAEKVAV
ncbi:MAG: hypothetical protein VKP62_06410 [Candidatus Sericytochromatia bacterium]|nr:hypothetical protein [Candidatus Sericytochromatia bacterium]